MFGKGYVGITVHWTDSKLLETTYVCLALQKLNRNHTLEVFAHALKKIHKDYGIKGKIVKITTDSGSNFIKDFTVFGEYADVSNNTSKLMIMRKLIQKMKINLVLQL